MIHGNGSTSGREERPLVERGRNDVTVSAADRARGTGPAPTIGIRSIVSLYPRIGSRGLVGPS